MRGRQTCWTNPRGVRSIQEGHFLHRILSRLKNPPPNSSRPFISLRKMPCLSILQRRGNTTIFRSCAKLDSVFGFLADYELFETALGIYDYDIALGGGSKSIRRWIQKVYLPSSETIHLPKFYGRYEVDLESKRYESALKFVCAWCRQESLETSDQVASGNSRIFPWRSAMPLTIV
jgi:hypothetical protein